MRKPHGFSKAKRLVSKKEIGRIFQVGKFHQAGWLQAKALPGSANHARYLVSVRKSVGSAPVRNRIKRIIREAIRLNQQELKGTHDICFFITRRPEEPVQLSTVEKEIRTIFNKLAQS